MPKYSLKTKFIFEGTFIVEAENKLEAFEKVEKHCGLVIGGNIHSSLPDNEIDWTFDVHPSNKLITSIKEID